MATFYPANVPLVNYFFYNYTNTANGPNLPLAGGKIFFFADEDHNLELPTYSNVNDPSNPVVNTDPIVLNAVGACRLFYTEDRLYYIVITGPDGDLDNPIWTFEHVDFSGGAGESGNDVTNYIPNGQFLLHNDLPVSGDYKAGQIREPVTNIAYGGWTFNRSEDSTAKDFVTFVRYTEWAATPGSNPLYAVNIKCTEADAGDAFKGIRVTYPDVNRFASATQAYTVAFAGIDNLAGDAPIELYLIKNFGTGGDAQTETLLDTFTLTPTESNFYYSFVYGTNANKVIGATGDDFVALEFRVRTDEAVDVLLTNFQQSSGRLVSPNYPETTQRQDVEAALGGAFPIPNPDGSDLYLPVRLTATGWEFDRSGIGKVEMCTYQTPNIGELFCNGTQYRASERSSDGIPYSRLQSVLIQPSFFFVPLYGTGLNFLSWTGYTTNTVTLLNNSTGTPTAPSDGSAPTGFTFNTTYPSSKQQVVATTVPASAMTPGCYFNIYGATGMTGYPYYFYYIIDGVGTDPKVTGAVGIPVALFSTDTAEQVAYKTGYAANTTFFCVPDLRGLFMRGWNDGAGRDPDAADRVALGAVPFIEGDIVGTQQSDDFLEHTHSSDTVINTSARLQGGTDDFLPAPAATTTGATGGSETRPINTNAMFVIKY